MALRTLEELDRHQGKDPVKKVPGQNNPQRQPCPAHVSTPQAHLFKNGGGVQDPVEQPGLREGEGIAFKKGK